MMRAARLRRPPGGWATAWIAALLLALLLWSVVYPNAAIIVGSFERGLGDWRDFAASPADRDALWGTVVVSIGSVIGALLIGVPLAFLLTRTEFRGRRLLSAVATLPAALPPLVGVLAFLFLYGESGVVTVDVERKDLVGGAAEEAQGAETAIPDVAGHNERWRQVVLLPSGAIQLLLPDHREARLGHGFARDLAVAADPAGTLGVAAHRIPFARAAAELRVRGPGEEGAAGDERESRMSSHPVNSLPSISPELPRWPVRRAEP